MNDLTTGSSRVAESSTMRFAFYLSSSASFWAAWIEALFKSMSILDSLFPMKPSPLLMASAVVIPGGGCYPSADDLVGPADPYLLAII